MDHSDVVSGVQFGDMRMIRDALKSRSVHANTTDADGCSLLHWAAINNRVAIAVLLVEHGADINCQGGVLMETPLHWAIRKNFYRIAKLLIDNGANSSIRSNQGLDVVHLCCQLGHLEMLHLLLSWGADANTVNDEGDTPLMSLIRTSAPPIDIVRLLLRQGADVGAQNVKTGDTVLHLLASKKFSDLLPFALLLYRAPGADTARLTQNLQGQTPWQVIMESRNPTLLRFVFDFYLYRHFPSWLPAFASAFSFAILLVLLELIGWWAIPVYLVLQSTVFDKAMQTTISSRVSKINQGLAWSLIASIAVYYNLYVQAHVSPSISGGFYLLVGLIVYTKYKVTTTRCRRVEPSCDSDDICRRIIASSPTEGPVEAEEVRSAIVRDPPISICPTCLVDKSRAAVHCSTCDACMSSMLDHHCSFIDNCVGEGNRRLFCCFIASCWMGAAVAFVFSSWTAASVYCPDSKNHGWFSWAFTVQKCFLVHYPSFALVTGIAGGVVIWMSLQLWGQVAMVALETTSFERSKCTRDVRVETTNAECEGLFLTGSYALTRRDGALDDERKWREQQSRLREQRRHGRRECDCDEESQSLLGSSSSRGHGSDTRSLYGNRFRQGSFDLEMPHSIGGPPAESMAMDRGLDRTVHRI